MARSYCFTVVISVESGNDRGAFRRAVLALGTLILELWRLDLGELFDHSGALVQALTGGFRPVDRRDPESSAWYTLARLPAPAGERKVRP